jgi:hypothetical protein
MGLVVDPRPIRLVYQQPASGTFLSQQTSYPQRWWSIRQADASPEHQDLKSVNLLLHFSRKIPTTACSGRT